MYFERSKNINLGFFCYVCFLFIMSAVYFLPHVQCLLFTTMSTVNFKIYNIKSHCIFKIIILDSYEEMYTLSGFITKCNLI